MNKSRNNNDHEREIELIIRYLDDALPKEEREEVESTLLCDPEFRMLLRELSEQAVVIADLERVQTAKRRTQPAQPRHRFRAFRSQLAVGLLATASLVLLAITLVSQFLWQGNRNQDVITIMALNGPVEWTGEGGRVQDVLQVGNTLPGGTIALNAPDAWIEVRLRDGSKFTLAGQSSLTLSDDGQKLLHLREGSLSASVEAQPEERPMIVRTQVAEVVVIGTQFNMNVGQMATLVSVNEGHVRVKRLADNQVAEVPANHHIVAEASRQNDFAVIAQPKSVKRWHSQLPGGIIHGKWLPEESALRATSLLWHDCEEKEKKPLLLFVSALSVTRGEMPLVELSQGSMVKVRGSTTKRSGVVVGLTTQHHRGGFAGKYSVYRKPETFPEAGGDFELNIPIEQFKPEKPKYPKSPIGSGLYDWWGLTINEDAGLKITSVELVPN